MAAFIVTGMKHPRLSEAAWYSVLPFLVLAFLPFTGCNQTPQPLVIWSNVPDTAFLVELYNSDADQPVRFRYVENLTEALTHQRVDADIVIGRWVNNPPTRALMVNNDDRQPWEPIAFNLGTVVFDGAHARLSPDFAVTLDEIGGNLRPRADSSDAPPETMRFVPTLSPRFLYEMVRIGGAEPEPAPGGGARWDADAFNPAFQAIRDWQTRWNESPVAEQEYRERYLYEPWYRLLDNRRVLGVYLPSNRLFDWSYFAGTTLDFRWLSDNAGMIPVLEDVVYVGIPLASTRRTQAYRFITWTTDPENQIRLMHHKTDQRIDSFGVFGGFSTRAETNRRMVREIHTSLAGRIPDPSSLVFPGPRPRYWDEALEAVIYPFLARSFTTTSLESDGSDQLQRELQRWYNQRGD